MIYVIGNSHANFFVCTHPSRQFEWNTLEPFSAISIGPPTAYHIMDKYKWAVLSQAKSTKFKEGDYIMPAFEEIDIRVHLQRQAIKQGRNIEDVIQECFMRYTRLYTFLKGHGYNIMVWGGQASSPKGHDPDNVDEPVYYSSRERNAVTKMWSELAKQYAKIYELPYLDLIDELLLKDGSSNPEYFMDYCHLKHNKCMPLLKEKIQGLVL